MEDREQYLKSNRRYLLPLFVLICGLSATALATYLVNENLRYRERQQLQDVRYQVERAIYSRIEAYIGLLRGGAGLFAANQTVTLQQFRQFVQRLEIQKRYPGLQGFGYSIHLRPQDLAPLESSMRRQGLTDFTVWPSGDSNELHSIVFLEPPDARNKRAIGYNMFTEPTRRRAMIAACDLGEPRLSGRVELVQESLGEDFQPGFLMYLPLYLGGDAPEDVHARRARLQGFVYSPFRAGDLFSSVAAQLQLRGQAFAVWDGNYVVDKSLLFRSSPAFDQKNVRDFSRMQVYGNTWTLAVARIPGGQAPVSTKTLWIIPLLGVIASLLLCYFTYAEIGQALRRKESERQLRETEETFALLVRLAEEYAIIIMGPDGRITDWNPGAQRIFGYVDEEVVGRESAIFFTPEDQAAEIPEARIRKAEADGQVSDEGWRVRKDGSRLWMSGSVVCLRTHDGRVRGFAKILRDITERKQTEESIKELNLELEERVLRRTAALQESKEQMEAFSYTVAHDLRAPLRAMQGFAHALQEDYRERLDESAFEYLTRIMRSAERMDALIQDLLEYSRLSGSELTFQSIPIAEVVQSAMQRLEGEIARAGAQIELHLEPAHAKAHRATLENAIANLIINAVKFARPGTTPKIIIRAMEQNGSVQICVQDNGIGIAPEHHGRIFRVFERLHAEDGVPGTGIGLAIVKKGVERMGGKVGVESEPNRGSLFWIELPKADPAG
ncbi:MAG TPA: CHASE domain-containing protein [Verrucomicrobiae bacterium]